MARTEYGLQMYCLRDITGTDLKDALRQVAEMGYKYIEFAGFFGHSAGTVVGLWDMQGGIGLKGEFPLHKNTCYALELNTESALEEWGGQVVRFSAEETVSFTEDGKMNYMFPGRDKMFAI